MFLKNMTLINIKHFENIHFNNIYFCCNFFTFLGFDTLFGDKLSEDHSHHQIMCRILGK